MVRRMFERYLNVGIFVMKAGRLYSAVMFIVYGVYLGIIKVVDYARNNFKKVILTVALVVGIFTFVAVINRLRKRRK